MKITILSGGTGNDALYKGIKKFYPEADIKVIVNAYDSGKSTGICRKITNTLGVSDIRKNHSRLYSTTENPNKNYMDFLEGRYSLDVNNEEKQVYEKLSYWNINEKFILDAVKHFFNLYKYHKNKYLFEDFNIANIVYSALFNKFGYEKTCELMTNFLGIEDNVLINSFDNVYIHANTLNGNIIKDEGDIVNHKNKDNPITKIIYVGNKNEILNEKATNRVLDSDLIIISSGTFWSSIYPTLDYGNFYLFINESKAKKIWIMNNEQDKDAYGVSSNDFIKIVDERGLYLDDFTIIENLSADPILQLSNYDYHIIREELGNINGKHNGELVSKCILKTYYNISKKLIFDFDDTIWSRKWKEDSKLHKISRENVQLLNELLSNYDITIVSGNSYKSIEDKIKTVMDINDFEVSIIADANAVLYEYGEMLDFNNNFVIKKKSIELIKDILKNYNFNIEINKYNTYIKIKPIDNKYRKLLSDYLNYIFVHNNLKLKANITGKTTIDIITKNNDKASLFNTNWISKESTYIGDEIDNGNDKTISEECNNFVKVKDVFETNTLLRLLK